MTSEEKTGVVFRFFQALDKIIANGTLKGRQTFTRLYNINRWNLYTVEDNPSSNMFDIAWLVYLVRDFGVNADWLLMGRGEMFYTMKDLNKLRKAHDFAESSQMADKT